ncbi:cp2 transcription factor protein [Mucor ambiguus]|uniref:Cp2 transcription factor protein n=1 Tax=Mucor ambiguus TaxID=91626 RepID=A0A0C9MSK2_9FUNG|nr:cp2 transcription factor protein [Mucor ambiguus]
MLFIHSFDQQFFPIPTTDITEIDEIKSSYSSLSSLKDTSPIQYHHHQHHHRPPAVSEESPFDHFLMNDDSGQPLYQQHDIDLTYQPSSGWSISNKSSSSQQQHPCVEVNEHLYIQTPSQPPFIQYDNTNSSFSDIMPSPDNLYQQFSNWSSNNQLHHQDIKETGRFNHAMTSPDFLLHNHKRQSPSFTADNNSTNSSNYLGQFPSATYTAAADMYQKPHNTQFNSPDANKFHPRFKSANARLDPYSAKPQHSYHQHYDQRPPPPPPQFMPTPLISTNLIDQRLFIDKSISSTSTDLQAFSNQDKNETLSSTSKNMPFQFSAVLHAPTAVTKKHDEQPVTYLNRGQAYLLDLESTATDSTLTSTISIAFHEASHRQIAENYWKYWISQQENPNEATAIDLDANQTIGVYNIRLVSFDRISFDWQGRFGAKVYVRFNCLSTDFSRIKGVKGIPMRAIVETTGLHYASLPSNSQAYKGTFERTTDNNVERYDYKESCYCKIKLFRDKGAERKNKDDKKQMAKQMEKVIASTNGNPEQHPLWPIISQAHQPTSSLLEIPTSPDITLDELSNLGDLFAVDEKLSLPPPALMASVSSSLATSAATADSKPRKSNCSFLPKRKRSASDQPNKQQLMKKQRKVNTVAPFPTALTFRVWARDLAGTPHDIFLDSFTTQNLKVKLAAVLSVHPSRISEMLWRKKRTNEQEKASDVLVLVEDTFIAEHIPDGENMTVYLEMKVDGNLRLILEF